LDSCEIPDESSIPDLSPTPTFVQEKEGRYSSSLASVAVGSNAFMGSPPLQDNEDFRFMVNQVKNAEILVEKVTRK
jgi:hypothetical protein